MDEKEIDSMGRRKTRIVAIDALRHPGSRQENLDCLLREVNKAFCGFLDQSKCQQYHIMRQCSESHEAWLGDDAINAPRIAETQSNLECMISQETGKAREQLMNKAQERDDKSQVHSIEGVVTGNWGCGVFGGDPEVKAIIQWLAASQKYNEVETEIPNLRKIRKTSHAKVTGLQTFHFVLYIWNGATTKFGTGVSMDTVS